MDFLIIDNDPVWQLKIQMMLSDFQNAGIEKVDTIQAATLFLTKHTPDLVLTDVVLPDGLSFDLLETIAPTYPVVFFTEFPDEIYFRRAHSFSNATFLIKPFHRFTLQSAVNCITDKVQLLNKTNVKPLREEGIWVTGKYRQKIMVPFKEIIYIEGEGNYITIHTAAERQYVMKTSLRKLAELLDNQFVQIHRGFIINRNFIHRIDIMTGEVNVKGVMLPIGRTFQKHLLTVVSQPSV
ncbi:MAG: LytTR family DNA-binding domain-containing protein [Spirosomataceae bacterium]